MKKNFKKNIFITTIFILIIIFPFVSAQQDFVGPRQEFPRGDVNSDGRIDLSDVVTTLRYLFSGGAPPSCFDAADADHDYDTDISDAIYIIDYLFHNGPEPLGTVGGIGCVEDKILLDDQNRGDRLLMERLANAMAEFQQLADNGKREFLTPEEVDILWNLENELFGIPPNPENPNWLDNFQNCLTGAGVLDPTPVCDLLNELINCLAGREVDIFTACFSAVPYLGDLPKAKRAIEIGGRVRQVILKRVIKTGYYAGATMKTIKGYLFNSEQIFKAYEKAKGVRMSINEFKKKLGYLMERIEQLSPRELMTGMNGNHIINNPGLANYIGPQILQVGSGELRVGFRILDMVKEKQITEEIVKGVKKKIEKEVIKDFTVEILYVTHHTDQHDVIEKLIRLLKEKQSELFTGQRVGNVYMPEYCADDDQLCLCLQEPPGTYSFCGDLGLGVVANPLGDLAVAANPLPEPPQPPAGGDGGVDLPEWSTGAGICDDGRRSPAVSFEKLLPLISFRYRLDECVAYAKERLNEEMKNYCMNQEGSGFGPCNGDCVGTLAEPRCPLGGPLGGQCKSMPYYGANTWQVDENPVYMPSEFNFGGISVRLIVPHCRVRIQNVVCGCGCDCIQPQRGQTGNPVNPT